MSWLHGTKCIPCPFGLVIAASLFVAAGAASHGAVGISGGLSRGSSCERRWHKDSWLLSQGPGSLRLRGGENTVLSPTVHWSQREKTLALKVDMPPGMHSADKLMVGEKSLTWDEANVKLNVELFKAVDASSARVHHDGGRQATIHVNKAEGGWWPRLSAEKGLVNVKVDWSSWKDEDEGDSEAEKKGQMGGGDDDFNYDDLAGMPDLQDDDKGTGKFGGMSGSGKGDADGDLGMDDDGDGKTLEEMEQETKDNARVEAMNE